MAALAGVFFSPSETFRKLVERPWWFALVPLVILTALVLISSYAFVSRVDMKEFVRDQIRQNKFASQQMSEDQIDEAAEKAAQRPKWIQPVVGGFGFAIVIVILAAIFWLVLLAFGENSTFGKSFQITAWAFLPGILSSLIFLVLLFIKNPNEMNIENPIFTNPAAFFDKESIAKPLYALLQAFDLFKAWIIVLLSIGLAAAAKCKASKTATAVVILYAVWVLIRVGLAAIF
jgi:hypothetical protein